MKQTWARQTRGFDLSRYPKAIGEKDLPSPEDPYNTLSDPATGVLWAERILPMTYEDLLAPLPVQAKVESDFIMRPKQP